MQDVIYDKVLGYLIEYVGEKATPGDPVFVANARQYRVPVLCKTSQGIFAVGEFVLDEDGEFVSVPSKEQMLRVLENAMKREPFLVYGDREELEAKGIELVTV